MLLKSQEYAVMSLAQVGPGCRVLDVGGGHGQMSRALLAAGCSVTILGSSEASFARVRRLFGNRVTCIAGDLCDPPFPDQSFDVVISLRILAHIRDERQFLAGLCRLARRRVVVDYPDLRSFNLFYRILFRLKRKLEGDTRTFRVFQQQRLTMIFASQGFGTSAAKPQFFWPVVLHRRLRRPRLSEWLEAPARWLGLTRVLGSPIVLCAERGTQA